MPPLLGIALALASHRPQHQLQPDPPAPDFAAELVYPTPARPNPSLTLGSYAPPPSFLGGATPFRTLSVPSAATSNRISPLDDEEDDEEDSDGETRRSRLASQISVEPAVRDELPAYSPRPGTIQARRLPTRRYTFSSKSQKLMVEIDAPGEAHILLIEGNGEDGQTWVEGQLTATLPTAEAITHIKIRLRAMVQTMVMRVHGSGRHPVNEDLLMWEDASTLWTSSSDPLPSNTSTDSSKLQGTFVFPFKLHLPSRVAIRTTNRDGTPGGIRKLRLPPSFVLSGDGSAAGARADWASCRYFIKVTLGRRGILKANERIMVPLVFQQKPVEIGGSVLRLAAVASHIPTPGPREDPGGWVGKKARQQVKRGLFSAKKAWYEVVLLLPTPARFSRYTEIPFAIKIVSSDPDVTGKFPRESVVVTLIQRAYVSAQCLSGSHDLYVGKASVEEDGPPGGEYVVGHDTEPQDSDKAVWGTHFRGALKLSQSVGSSFRAPNLVVTYQVNVHISVPGAGNDLGLAWPVEICAALPPLPQPHPPQPAPAESNGAEPISIPSTSTPTAQAEASRPRTQFSPRSPIDARLGLPPSYFELAAR